MIRKGFLCMVAFCCLSQAQAQIFGRILDRASDKLENRIENEIVERVSEEIARAAWKPIDKALDDMLAKRYEEDKASGKTSASYSDYIAAMYQKVELPASYNMDLLLECEATDYDKKKNKMDIYMSKDSGVFGFSSEDNPDEIMILDIDNDITAMYNLKKKEVMALPNMFSVAATVAAASVEQEVGEAPVVTKTGKTKKIAGYQCDEYIVDDETNETTAYVAPEFPVNFNESFKELMLQVLPASRMEELPAGFTLKSISKTKKKGKKNTFEVKKVIEENFSFDNTEYKQITLAEE